MIKKYKAFTLIELSIVILIIGIVISAIIAADLLISKARISSAQSITKSSPIISIKDVSFWLESVMPASFEAGESSDGTTLSRWYDGSIAKVNASASGSDMPTYSNTINGIHAVKFNGSNQFFSIDASSLNSSYYTIFVVDKRLSNKTDNYFIGDPSSTTLNQSLLLGYSLDNKVIHSQGGSNSYTASIDSYASSANKARIFSFVSSASGKSIYVNGILAATSNNSSQLSGITNLKIGKGYFGEIGEIAVFSRALTSGERQDVEDYLAKKFVTKKYNGSCVNGSISSDGSCIITCTFTSVNGISNATTVAQTSGATTMACNSASSGSVTYTCNSSGVLNVSSNTCSHWQDYGDLTVYYARTSGSAFVTPITCNSTNNGLYILQFGGTKTIPSGDIWSAGSGPFQKAFCYCITSGCSPSACGGSLSGPYGGTARVKRCVYS